MGQHFWHRLWVTLMIVFLFLAIFVLHHPPSPRKTFRARTLYWSPETPVYCSIAPSSSFCFIPVSLLFSLSLTYAPGVSSALGAPVPVFCVRIWTCKCGPQVCVHSLLMFSVRIFKNGKDAMQTNKGAAVLFRRHSSLHRHSSPQTHLSAEEMHFPADRYFPAPHSVDRKPMRQLLDLFFPWTGCVEEREGPFLAKDGRSLPRSLTRLDEALQKQNPPEMGGGLQLLAPFFIESDNTPNDRVLVLVMLIMHRLVQTHQLRHGLL